MRTISYKHAGCLTCMDGRYLQSILLHIGSLVLSLHAHAGRVLCNVFLLSRSVQHLSAWLGWDLMSGTSVSMKLSFTIDAKYPSSNGPRGMQLLEEIEACAVEVLHVYFVEQMTLIM